MSFSEELLVVIVEKAIIALGLLLIAYWFNRRLERDKANEGIRQKIAASRAATYLSLWQLTAEIDAVNNSLMTPEAIEKLLNKVTSWYYQEGNGLYLSHEATSLFLECRGMLKGTSLDVPQIKSGFSRLRTQLKQDIGVYDEQQAHQPVK
jgi:hypothetical protein